MVGNNPSGHQKEHMMSVHTYVHIYTLYVYVHTMEYDTGIKNEDVPCVLLWKCTMIWILYTNGDRFRNIQTTSTLCYGGNEILKNTVCTYSLLTHARIHNVEETSENGDLRVERKCEV